MTTPIAPASSAIHHSLVVPLASRETESAAGIRDADDERRHADLADSS